MKKTIIKIAIALTIGSLFVTNTYAAMDGHAKKEMAGAEMNHDEHKGKSIREVKIDGYMLAYHLIDNMEQMDKMKDMKGMSMDKNAKAQMKSHHLMVYVMNSDGKIVEDAKIGYLVKNPAGEKAKAMAMGMKDGMGADVDMTNKGSYEINVKIMTGDKKLLDKFSYEVK
jgi:hypothetical protein